MPVEMYRILLDCALHSACFLAQSERIRCNGRNADKQKFRTKRIDSQDKIKIRKAVDNQIGTVKTGFYG